MWGLFVRDDNIKGRDKYLHPTLYVGCDYLFLSLIGASGTLSLDMIHQLFDKHRDGTNHIFHYSSELLAAKSNAVFHISVMNSG